jgi:uncharacterized GH25 family protein
MFKPRFLFALAALALTAAPLVEAHELKVLASHLFLPKSGERTTIYLSWGHVLPVDELVDAGTLDRYELLAPGGSATTLKTADLSLQTNVIEIKDEGAHQVLVARKPAVFTFVEDKDNNRLMKRGPKTAVKEGAIDYAFRSQQFAKALIVAGPAKVELIKPAGLALEIAPLDVPAEWRSGGTLRFQVLFQGKPVPEESLVATYVGFKPDNAWCFATSTNREGIASVRASQAGTWVLRVNVRKPAANAVRDQYDVEWYTSTLALEIRP